MPSLSAIVQAARSLGHDDTAQPSEPLARLLASYSTSDLRALVSAYEANNADLAHVAASLHRKSNQLECSYRKVVALCTGVPEESVEENLPSLVAAVESERGALGREEAARVREFLLKVEGVAKGQGQEDEDDREVSATGGAGQGTEGQRTCGGRGVLETPQRMGHKAMAGLQRGLMGPPELPV